MNKQLVQQITATQIRPDLPRFNTGDTIRVSVKIRENNKERQQIFEGVCISIRGAGVSKTFKVRKESAGIGVERTFLLNSPEVVFIEIAKHGKVRRKKLFYLRKRHGKGARIKQILMGEEQKKALEEQRAISKKAAEAQAKAEEIKKAEAQKAEAEKVQKTAEEEVQKTSSQSEGASKSEREAEGKTEAPAQGEAESAPESK